MTELETPLEEQVEMPEFHFRLVSFTERKQGHEHVDDALLAQMDLVWDERADLLHGEEDLRRVRPMIFGCMSCREALYVFWRRNFSHLFKDTVSVA